MIIEEKEDDLDYDNLVHDSDKEIDLIFPEKTNHISNDSTEPIVGTYKSEGSTNGRYIYKGSNNGLYYSTENFKPEYVTKRAKFCVKFLS
ncbi:unnamed protein product [Brachionus calyciflorus]|uniref:Uncharacterized protein n=1 Tax=Brachionus calyciflorus TaxID=104777 RepID=A0A813VKB3_9BILA|nr:unnamed protein product [Brachionus calyciflorus]